MTDTLLPSPAPAGPAALSPLDSLDLYLREKFGLPAGWRCVRWDSSAEAAPEGFVRVVGAVYVPREADGLGWRGRDRSTERTLFADRADWRRWEESLAAARGVCPDCWGTGRVFQSWSAAEGKKTRACGRCGGTGLPVSPPAAGSEVPPC